MLRTIRQICRFAVVILLALLAPGQIGLSGASSIPQDNLGGKTLMNFCNSKDATDIGLCSGYILGIAEAMNAGISVYNLRSCNQDGVRAQQLTDLVRMTLAENPALQAQKAGPMVAGVLAKTFPCYESGVTASGDDKITIEPLPHP